MAASVLVINCGSSSIKYALVNEVQPQTTSSNRIQGLAENLGTPQARIKGIGQDNQSFTLDIPDANHTQALQALLQQLAQYSPQAIGHRVVHGGEQITSAQKITPKLIKTIQNAAALAPLHNPVNLIGIEATLQLFPELPQVAVFDTAFHQSMPAQAFHYALPYHLYSEHAVRRYGFHGTSHAYVSERASQLCGTPQQGGWLSAHLGNGCSTCAIWNGKSLDTSMGLTPLEGLVMGTRSGDVDPGLHQFLADNLGWSLDKINQVLNRDSGLLGLSGLSNDMRTLIEASAQGNIQAQLAIDVFCYRLAKSLASMSCALPQIDGLIFTGGIGENAALIRQKTVDLLKHFGFVLDLDKNQQTVRGIEGRIDQHDAAQNHHYQNHAHQNHIHQNHVKRPQIWVIPTDEEGRIALETRQVLGL